MEKRSDEVRPSAVDRTELGEERGQHTDIGSENEGTELYGSAATAARFPLHHAAFCGESVLLERLLSELQQQTQPAPGASEPQAHDDAASVPSRAETISDDDTDSLSDYESAAESEEGDASPRAHAAEEGDAAASRAASAHPINARDHRGHTPLHVAAFRGHVRCVRLLLEAGADPTARSRDRWTAIDEAVAAMQRECVIELIFQRARHVGRRYRARIPKLTESLERFPDVSFRLAWYFRSSYIPFVRSMAPNDVFTITKRGSNVRLDMTLVGYSGMRPKRGRLSFLFQGTTSETPGNLLVVDYQRGIVGDAFAFGRKVRVAREDFEEDADDMLENGSIMRGGASTADMELAPRLARRSLWSGLRRFAGGASQPSGDEAEEDRRLREKVGPYNSFVYDVVGVSMRARVRRFGNQPLEHSEGDHEKYFGASVPPFPPQGQLQNIERRVHPTMWLSEECPLTLEALVSLLEALAPASERLQQVKQYINARFPADLFPVRIDIPLIASVHAVVEVQDLQLAPRVDEDIFAIPADFQRVALDEMVPTNEEGEDDANEENSSTREELAAFAERLGITGDSVEEWMTQENDPNDDERADE